MYTISYSYNVANTVATVHYCKLSHKNIATIAWTGIVEEKKDVAPYEDLLTIIGTKYSIFNDAARASGLSKSEDFFINETLDEAAHFSEEFN
ncbi:hypothetical protein TNCV_4810271 [Trichonephila clavipes]|nr:hypothetical protein TNCV_4810271 [Trichonephila clavipes]